MSDIQIQNGPAFPPEGWTAHPETAGWWYKGKEVLNEQQLRERYKRYHHPRPTVASSKMPATMEKRRDNMIQVIEAAGNYHEDAIAKLSDIMEDPDATTAQVRAAESLIAWAAGAPERFVHVELDIKRLTVSEAMDAVIGATMTGVCSLEAGQALMAMLKTKSDVIEMTALQEQLNDLREMVKNVASARGPVVING